MPRPAVIDGRQEQIPAVIDCRQEQIPAVINRRREQMPAPRRPPSRGWF